MSRVKRGTLQRRRHNKILKQAKGFRGLSGTLFTLAKRRVIRAGTNAYRHRRTKKRDFRSLWIVRMNAALRMEGISYSRFINMLTLKKIALNRKMLSEIAIHEPKVFTGIVNEARK